MAGTRLRVVVIADRTLARIARGWEEVRPMLEAEPSVEVLAVDEGAALDFAALSPDFVLVLGGDGAILRACRSMGRSQAPILGVNFGRLGFLADLSAAELCQQLPNLVARRFHVVRHLMFESTLHRGGRTESFLGLNETIVASGGALRIIDVRLAVDGEPVTSYNGDGLIISTPVGSTAHNLSAGGPILRQDLQAFVITPICPHTLTNRPLVEGGDREFTLTLPNVPAGTTLVIDGQVKRPLEPGDRVTIRKADVSLHLVKTPGSSYFQTLHRKLGWGGQPNYQQ
jgi:NAD+ kinase